MLNFKGFILRGYGAREKKDWYRLPVHGEKVMIKAWMRSLLDLRAIVRRKLDDLVYSSLSGLKSRIGKKASVMDGAS